VKAYPVGPGVTTPELLPTQHLEITPERCKKKRQDAARFFLIVDPQGTPRTYYFLHPLGNELDDTLIQILTTDRFKPGIHEGSPAAVALSLEMTVESCVDRFKDDAGNKLYRSRIRSQPAQKLLPLPNSLDPSAVTPEYVSGVSQGDHAAEFVKVGGAVSWPTPVLSVEAHYSKEAKEKAIQGISLISLVVDEHGMPQKPHVVKAAGYGLDEKAVEAVNLY
jgi:hypothetical protein